MIQSATASSSDEPARLPAGVTLRRARPLDVEAVAQLGLHALKRDPLPGLLISYPRVRAAIHAAITGAGNYCWVAEKDGKIVAAVSALVHDMMCYERLQATVIQFYTTVPGAGVPLLRAFLTWARARRGIKLIIFTLETRGDPRIGKLLKRLGLTSELPVYMETR